MNLARSTFYDEPAGQSLGDAKVVQKIVWTSVGTNEITWNGRNAFSEIQGDGVYPYRVVDASNKVLGKGKILVINK